MNSDSGSLFDDDTVYERTAAGQAQLLSANRDLSRLERRSLDAVTGFTSMRVLPDLGFDEREIVPAVIRLLQRRLAREG